VDYLKGHRGGLSKDSQDRLDRNPLRIFDSKDPDDQEILVDAPKLADHLNQASQDFFDTVCNGLDAAGVAYTLNSGLVRGLDYYSHTAFEFVTDTLGAQGTVLAGGRYDGLIETMGGPRTPGIGWAAGIERLAMMIGDPPAATRPIAVIPVNADAGAEALILALQLRRAGFSIDLGYSGNLKKRLNRADKANALAAVLMGEENLGNGVVTVRDMGTGEQTEIGLSALEDHLARYR
jgi:histidyl-tRNA synthetase